MSKLNNVYLTSDAMVNFKPDLLEGFTYHTNGFYKKTMSDGQLNSFLEEHDCNLQRDAEGDLLIVDNDPCFGDWGIVS